MSFGYQRHVRKQQALQLYNLIAILGANGAEEVEGARFADDIDCI